MASYHPPKMSSSILYPISIENIWHIVYVYILYKIDLILKLKQSNGWPRWTMVIPIYTHVLYIPYDVYTYIHTCIAFCNSGKAMYVCTVHVYTCTYTQNVHYKIMSVACSTYLYTCSIHAIHVVYMLYM